MEIEAGASDRRIAIIDVGPALAEAAAATAPLFLERDIALSVDSPATLPPVRGDVDRVVQVIVNLLSNAAKFTPVGGRVRLEAQRDGGVLRVRVTDSGPGVAAEERELVFQRFHRSATAVAGDSDGTGLGLAISRRIVERLGGRIGVEDASTAGPPESGHGASFWFTLPLAEAGAGAMPPERDD
ncbi:hypothetical protein AZL_022640 [Azospirillum sp. B510]|nr:hypothetical protein AZL_022640 [Azospirillum sp. B510]